MFFRIKVPEILNRLHQATQFVDTLQIFALSSKNPSYWLLLTACEFRARASTFAPVESVLPITSIPVWLQFWLRHGFWHPNTRRSSNRNNYLPAQPIYYACQLFSWVDVSIMRLDEIIVLYPCLLTAQYLPLYNVLYLVGFWQLSESATAQ